MEVFVKFNKLSLSLFSNLGTVLELSKIDKTNPPLLKLTKMIFAEIIYQSKTPKRDHVSLNYLFPRVCVFLKNAFSDTRSLLFVTKAHCIELLKMF